LTFLLVIDTSRYSPRTVEQIRSADGYDKHDVFREFEIPVNAEPATAHERKSWRAYFRLLAAGEDERPEEPEVEVLLPVIRLGRGALVDNLEVCSPGGGRIPTLNSAEYAAAVALIIETVATKLGGPAIVDAEFEAALERLLNQPTFAHLHEGGVEAGEAARREVVEEVGSRLLGLEPPAQYASGSALDEWLELLERLHDFVDAVSDAYIVFAPLKARPGARVAVSYSFTNPHRPYRQVEAPASIARVWRGARTWIKSYLARRPPPLEKEAPLKLGLRDWIRYATGLRPHRRLLKLTEHRWSQSYHLDFWGPDETYVYSCDAVAAEEREEGERPGSIVTFPQEGERGCDYAHIYVRETSREDFREVLEIFAAVDSREKPPGMLGTIALVATAEALLIWVLGLHIDDFYPSTSSKAAGISSDVPALLLALPGIVTGWLGTQFTGERLRATSLSTLSGLVLTGIIAIVSTATALAKATEDTLGSHFWAAHPLWLALMAVSGVLAVDLVVRGAVRSWRYVGRINIPGDDRTLLM
jgi:hypothetical protein